MFLRPRRATLRWLCRSRSLDREKLAAFDANDGKIVLPGFYDDGFLDHGRPPRLLAGDENSGECGRCLLHLAVSGGLRVQGKRLPAPSLVLLLAGLFYVAAMCVIFAMISADLKWALDTGANRVVRSGALMLLVAAVVALRDQERKLVLSPGGRARA